MFFQSAQFSSGDFLLGPQRFAPSLVYFVSSAVSFWSFTIKANNKVVKSFELGLFNLELNFFHSGDACPGKYYGK